MTDTQNTATEMQASSLATDNYETLIIFAGVMNLIKTDDDLIAFGQARDFMTTEMKDILFLLISYRISMKKQKILGVVPVLQPYQRLHPLFYRLSQSEDLYYTVEDTLLRMKTEKIGVSSETEDVLMRLRGELNRHPGKTSKSKEQKAAYRALEQEYEIREADARRSILTEATFNEINHRVLTNLTTEQRRTLLNGPAPIRDSILAVLKFFNERFIAGIQREKLETSITPVNAIVAPLYNYDMSMEGTLERVIHLTIDYSKEFAKLQTLKERIRRNPHDNTSQRQYNELLQETGTPNPFRKLRKTFDDDNAALDKISRRKSTDEEIAEARAKLEEYMQKYASIVDMSVPAVQQVATTARETTVVFVESE